MKRKASLACFCLSVLALAFAATATAADGARAKPRPAVITTGGSQFGTMLFDRKDQAIYGFDKEDSKKSRCYGACARAWPPVLTRGKPKAKGKARSGLLGRTKRRGGAVQVTYAGRPLYYYAHEGPGEVFCHNVFEFGGLWLVMRPDGRFAE